MYNNFFPENRAVYEIIWSQAGHRRHYGANALHAKATHTQTHTHTHTKRARACNNNCFVRQQWLLERASMLHYTYISCLVKEWPLSSMSQSSNK
jgi:hypothetical protein